MPKTDRVPAYRHHKATGQARVILGGKHHYLGRYGSEESKAAYARLIAEHAASPNKADPVAAPNDTTIVEIVAAYLHYADRYYRRPDGAPTGQIEVVKAAVRPLRKLYGDTPALEFGPLRYRAARQAMIDEGLSRGCINQRTRLIRAVFKWAASEEMLPESIYRSLATVPGLKAGRSEAREADPVGPVADAWVDATLPYLSATVATMVQLQRLTGMRPGEVCVMRAIDVDPAGTVWTYSPPCHKNAWRGQHRAIPLGPKAQALIRPYLTTNLEARLFQPRISVQEHATTKRQARQSAVQPSQRDRKKKRPKMQPGDAYEPRTYNHAIQHGILAANKAIAGRAAASGRSATETDLVPHWHSNQLRHSHATRVRRMFGLETAQATLGHATVDATQLYAERNQQLAIEVARKIG